MKPPVCPACGARLPEGATHCDLCGHDLTATPPADDIEPLPVPMPAQVTMPPRADAVPEAAGPFCVHCGAKNPDYARFCYQCGHALHAAAVEGSVPVAETVPVVPAPPSVPSVVGGTRPDSDAGKRALTLVGAGVLAVLVLFFITESSRPDGPTAPASTSPASPPPVPTASAPLPDEIAARAAVLEDEIAGASGEERLSRQEELVRLYAQAAAFPEAAALQQDVAEARQTALAWADAGSFYLATMLRTQGPDRASYAQQAAAAYERSLELDASDLDVKTDLATAYLNDAQNPMLAVQTVKDVLAEEPDHVRANFNYGLMLSQINRTDQALEQFDKVVALTEPDDPVHQRAEQERARLRAASGGTANG